MKSLARFNLSKLIMLVVVGAAANSLATPAYAGPIALDTFYQFAFFEARVARSGLSTGRRSATRKKISS